MCEVDLRSIFPGVVGGEKQTECHKHSSKAPKSSDLHDWIFVYSEFQVKKNKTNIYIYMYTSIQI